MPATMSATRDEVLELQRLLSEHAVIRAPEGQPFTLASGRQSYLYFDAKTVILAPEAFLTIGKLLWDQAKQRSANGIGGLAAGAIPLAMAAVAYEAIQGGSQLRGFYVRPEPKSHGTGESVFESCGESGGPGPIAARERLLVVDDVLTSGTSISGAMDEVAKRGASVEAIVVLIDRMEGGVRVLREKYGVPIVALFQVDREGNLSFCGEEVAD